MSDIRFLRFNVDDACILQGSTKDINAFRLNQVSGPAYSAYLNNKLVACGGIRTVGIGECWAIYSPKAREDSFERKRQIVVHTRAWLDRIIRDESLWHVWSESPKAKPNQNFLEHMGFRKMPAFLRG